MLRGHHCIVALFSSLCLSILLPRGTAVTLAGQGGAPQPAVVEQAPPVQLEVGETQLSFTVNSVRVQHLSGQSEGGANQVISAEDERDRVSMLIEAGAELRIDLEGSGQPRIGGHIRHEGGLRITAAGGHLELDPLVLLAPTRDSPHFALAPGGELSTASLVMQTAHVHVDLAAGTVMITSDDVALTPTAATTLGQPELAGRSIGNFTLRARLARPNRPAPSENAEGTSGAIAGVIGPDIIVGDLHAGVASYGSENGISAFSVGTTSCNQGDQEAVWISSTSDHPVIAQNMFRLRGGRFEQIGQSWLKHGFFALQQNFCGLGCQPSGTGSHLGVGCSDPYSASLNGQQSNLGPKWEVNAFTGVFPYPPTRPPLEGTAVERRLQVKNTDLDPALNAGALYFVEGHYVTPDDAAAGNGNNNASYRQVSVQKRGTCQGGPRHGSLCYTDGDCTDFSTQPPTEYPCQPVVPDVYDVRATHPTQRMEPAIRAWRSNDPNVVETFVPIANEGLFILGAKATDLGNGTWHYEYAVQNLNSHRSAGSFSVPIDPAMTITNAGFHDVDYHSGEPWDGTDWAVATSDTALTWFTEDIVANSEANALRWGTLYNFRFDADRAPETTEVTLGLFRPGEPASVTAESTGPTVFPVDCSQCLAVNAPTPEPVPTAKSRYISFSPPQSACRLALRVTFSNLPAPFDVLNGNSLWVGPPEVLCERANQARPGLQGCGPAPGLPSSIYAAATLQCDPYYADWRDYGTLHVYHNAIVPLGTYDVTGVGEGCDPGLSSSYSSPLMITTSMWADLVSDCITCPCGGPNNDVDLADTVAILHKFANANCAVHKVRADLEVASRHHVINLMDLLHTLAAFSGAAYHYAPEPWPCGE